MICMRLPNAGCLIPTCMFNHSWREAVLFVGSNPNRHSRPKSTKADIPMTMKESIFSATSVSYVSTRDAAPSPLYMDYPFLLSGIRLTPNKTVRVWFSPNRLQV